MKRLWIPLVCLLLLGFGAQSALAVDTTWYPGTSAIGLDARSLAMGGASLAVADNWSYPTNPAALVFVQDQGVFVGTFVNPTIEYPVDPGDYRAWGDQTLLTVDYVHPAADAQPAYSLSYRQDEYIYARGEPGQDFYHSYDTVQLGYGFAVNDKLALGLNIRWVNSADQTSGSDRNAHFLTFDAGALLTINKILSASVLITDVGAPTFTIPGSGQEFTANTRIMFGGCVRLGNLVIVAADVDGNVTGWSDLINATRVGAELRLGLVTIRAGMYHGQYTMGFGVILGSRDSVQLTLDFAQFFPPSGQYLSPVQCLQFSLFF